MAEILDLGLENVQWGQFVMVLPPIKVLEYIAPLSLCFLIICVPLLEWQL